MYINKIDKQHPYSDPIYIYFKVYFLFCVCLLFFCWLLLCYLPSFSLLLKRAFVWKIQYLIYHFCCCCLFGWSWLGWITSHRHACVVCVCVHNMRNVAENTYVYDWIHFEKVSKKKEMNGSSKKKSTKIE